MSRKFYITTPIYYVNARPHIGHAYTTIACDTIARRQRLLGAETFFLTGTDEHGQKIERAAQAAGKTPQQYADEISAEFRQLWKRMGISNDDFIRTTEDRHTKRVQELFRRIRDNGFIYKGTYTGQYCVSDELYVDGAQPGDPCPTCGRITETVKEENYFFKLSAFQEKLLALYTNPDFIRPEARRNEVISFVRSGLRDQSISRSTFSWGIPVPDDPKHVIYVWFDALANYLTAIGYGSSHPGAQEAFKKFWPADVQMIGKEIVRFHCVYWPAFLMAAGLPMPKTIVAHGWLLFEESKMSKSRGNIVRTETILDVLGADALRYFLLREVVFGQDGSFSFDALVQRYIRRTGRRRPLRMLRLQRRRGRPSANLGRCLISFSFRALSNPRGRWWRRWTSTSLRTSLGRWAKSRMKIAARVWRQCFTRRRKRCGLRRRWPIR
jgi:methionyl-tRNA synthetase